MDSFISCENLVKIYKVADIEVVALQGLDLTVERGEMIGIVGSSGSGKSSLLNVLGGLDRPSAGRVTVAGLDLLKASNRVLDRYRRTRVGFVWQQSSRNLVPYLTAQQNVELPMTIAGIVGHERREWAKELLDGVGLQEFRHGYQAQLSGGQQQRVAIATALANKPQLLLADEPTGELDSRTSIEVLELLRAINKKYGTTIIIVTHDPETAAHVDRVVTMRDGRTSSETIRRVADVEAALAEELALAGAHQYDEFLMVDSAGRLQLPADLIDKAGIGDRVTLERTDDGVLIRAASTRGRILAPTSETEETETPPTRRSRGWRQLLQR